jgi:hypothetical protein
MLKAAFLILSILLSSATASAQTQSPSSAQEQRTPSAPIEAIGAIVDAFRSHSIVTIEAAHGDEQMLAFTLALIRDPRFAAVANDLVVEEGNARYQDVMDRYVRGEDVPISELRQVWENHTVPLNATGRSTIIPEVYRTVREINSSRPRDRQLRVLLGDPPIDWGAVKTPADHRKWIEMRDSHPAALVQLEVLAKGRRALVTYGQMHLPRRQILANYDMKAWQAQTLVSILERTTPTKVFSVWREPKLVALLPEAASWRVPMLALTRNTVLGAIDFGKYSVANLPRASIQDGRLVPVPKDQWRVLPMEEQFDAVLYLGPRPSLPPAAPNSPEMCSDRGFLEERLRRLTLGGPPGSADRLKQYCAALATAAP